MDGRRYPWALSILCFIVVGCDQPQKIATKIPVKPDVVHLNTLEQFGSYNRFVALETHPDALLGEISKVKVDPTTGDLLVADRRVTKSLYRFDDRGRFIRKYGNLGSGPGEYEQLFSFEIMNDGGLALFTDGKVLAFAADGTFLHATPVDFNGRWAARAGERIFAYKLAGRESKSSTIVALDQQLNRVTNLHPFDLRQDKLILMPHNTLASSGKHLIVSDFYDFQLSVYDAKGSYMRTFVFPNQNYRLDTLWQLPPEQLKTPKNLQSLVAGLARVQYLYAFGSRVFFIESAERLEHMRPYLFDPASGSAIRFDGIQLIGGDEHTGYLTMSNLVGAYAQGLIGVGNDPELFEHYRKNHPEASLKFSDLDNPILMFFEIRPHGEFMRAGL